MLIISWLTCAAFAALAQAQQDSFPAFQSLASSALVKVSAGQQALSPKDLSVFIFLSPECPLPVIIRSRGILVLGLPGVVVWVVTADCKFARVLLYAIKPVIMGRL